jgi:hypothetical protein
MSRRAPRHGAPTQGQGQRRDALAVTANGGCSILELSNEPCCDRVALTSVGVLIGPWIPSAASVAHRSLMNSIGDLYSPPKL